MEPKTQNQIIRGILHPFRSSVELIKGNGFSCIREDIYDEVILLPIGICLDLAAVIYLLLFGPHLFTPGRTILGYLAGLFLAFFTYAPIGAIVQFIYNSTQTEQQRTDREKEKLRRITTKEANTIQKTTYKNDARGRYYQLIIPTILLFVPLLVGSIFGQVAFIVMPIVYKRGITIAIIMNLIFAPFTLFMLKIIKNSFLMAVSYVYAVEFCSDRIEYTGLRKSKKIKYSDITKLTENRLYLSGRGISTTVPIIEIKQVDGTRILLCTLVISKESTTNLKNDLMTHTKLKIDTINNGLFTFK